MQNDDKVPHIVPVTVTGRWTRLERLYFEDFYWSRAADGFRWVAPGDYSWPGRGYSSNGMRPHGVGSEKVLVPRPTDWHAVREELRPMLDEPQLFRAFARLGASEPKIQIFAKKYGDLTSDGGGNAEVSITLCPDLAEDYDNGKGPGRRTDGSMMPLYGTFRSTWYREIELMQECLSMLDALKSSDEDALSEWVTWRKIAGELKYIVTPKSLKLDSLQHSGANKLKSSARFFTQIPFDQVGTSKVCKDGDVRYPVVDFLCIIMSHRTRAHCGVGVVPDVQPGKRELLPRLRIRPNNLLGAMWLQFLNDFNEKLQWRNCLACGEPMLIDPRHGRRRSRTYCSGRCRQQGHRARTGK